MQAQRDHPLSVCVKRGKERPTASGRCVCATHLHHTNLAQPATSSESSIPRAPCRHLIAEARHGRLRSQPPMQSPLKHQHLTLLHAQVRRTQRQSPSLQLQAVPEFSTALLPVHGVIARENSRHESLCSPKSDFCDAGSSTPVGARISNMRSAVSRLRHAGSTSSTGQSRDKCSSAATTTPAGPRAQASRPKCEVQLACLYSLLVLARFCGALQSTFLCDQAIVTILELTQSEL